MIKKASTTKLLEKLRKAMVDSTYVQGGPLHAYFVPSGDAHQSEYIAPCDQRRAFISGFTGSTGTAIVTETMASLWTDGRYFLQAEQQLDSNWTLIKDDVYGMSSSVTFGSWLNSVLESGSRIGVDPFLMSAEAWSSLSSQLEPEGNKLVAVDQNLIDIVWEDRPARPSGPINPWLLQYSGKTWQDKVKDVRAKMLERNATLLIVTALDEIAWLLNLRGSDVQCNPVFFSYVVLAMDKVHIFIDSLRINDTLRDFLTDSEPDPIPVVYHSYDDIKTVLPQLLENTNGKAWIGGKSSYGLIHLVPTERQVYKQSPIQLLKGVKNSAEIQGMKNCSIRDAVALCEYFHWLENEVPKNNVTEISGAVKLKEFRSLQEHFMGDSFPTISSSGSHGAIIHYQPSTETDRPITTNEIYLCDSGGQYLDGTTDVTRTFHFGTPSQYEKDCFTRVLKGHINLATTKFPRLLKGQMLDTLARTSLWSVGLNYRHGTGHGVGVYLNVHEGPSGIGQRVSTDDQGVQENMILTIEPGYYEDGKFGCRIENVNLVVKAETKYFDEKSPFLTFEPLTLVPIQLKLIDASILTTEEIKWLNDYHQRCRTVIGAVLEKQGLTETYQWLLKETLELHPND